MLLVCENRQITLLRFRQNIFIICALQLFLLYTKIFRLYRKSCGEAIASPIIILFSLSWEYPGQFFCRDAPTGSSCTVQNESLMPIPARYRYYCTYPHVFPGCPDSYLFCFPAGGVTFLLRQESNQRMRLKGGAEKLLPQLQAPSLKYPSRSAIYER